MDTTDSVGEPHPPQSGSLRRSSFSTSASKARAAELQRIRALSPIERMALALRLGRRRRQLAESCQLPRPEDDGR